MSGFSIALEQQAISPGLPTIPITIAESPLIAVGKLSVATTDPSATVQLEFIYTDNSGINPNPTSGVLDLAVSTNMVTFVLPLTPSGSMSVRFITTGSAGQYNALIVFK